MWLLFKFWIMDIYRAWFLALVVISVWPIFSTISSSASYIVGTSVGLSKITSRYCTSFCFYEIFFSNTIIGVLRKSWYIFKSLPSLHPSFLDQAIIFTLYWSPTVLLAERYNHLLACNYPIPITLKRCPHCKSHSSQFSPLIHLKTLSHSLSKTHSTSSTRNFIPIYSTLSGKQVNSNLQKRVKLQSHVPSLIHQENFSQSLTEKIFAYWMSMIGNHPFRGFLRFFWAYSCD